MTKPLLHRRGSTRTDDVHYEISGYGHLVVEPEYCGSSQPEYWLIRDTRFSAGLDKWSRWQVLVVTRLEDARSWIQAGGPVLWDPERKKTDRNWRPIPDGWQAGEARGEVPRRGDPGVSTGQRVAVEHRGPVWGEGRQADRRRDADPGKPSDRDIWPTDIADKKYAVCPGWVTSSSHGERYFINFGALAWMYRVKPSECVEIPEGLQGRVEPEGLEHLVWLYPQRHGEDYESMRQELARGEDAFRLEDPDFQPERAPQTG